MSIEKIEKIMKEIVYLDENDNNFYWDETLLNEKKETINIISDIVDLVNEDNKYIDYEVSELINIIQSQANKNKENILNHKS